MLGNIFLNIGLTFNQMGEHIASEKNLNVLLNFHQIIKKYQNQNYSSNITVITTQKYRAI